MRGTSVIQHYRLLPVRFADPPAADSTFARRSPRFGDFFLKGHFSFDWRSPADLLAAWALESYCLPPYVLSVRQFLLRLGRRKALHALIVAGRDDSVPFPTGLTRIRNLPLLDPSNSLFSLLLQRHRLCWHSTSPLDFPLESSVCRIDL